MSKSIRVERDVPMRTRDGVTLRSDVYRPDDDGKYPAILVRTPYNKRIDCNLNTGSPIGEDAEGIPAVQTVLHARGQVSYIDLPTIPSRR